MKVPDIGKKFPILNSNIIKNPYGKTQNSKMGFFENDL